jgi:hypothetical protein
VLPLHVGYLFETGDSKKPGASLSRDFPRIWLLKKEKYKSEDDRGGVKVAKVNLPLSWGERRSVRGRTSCADEEKNKRGRIIGEGSSTAQEGGAQQNYVPLFGGIPAPPSYYGGVPMQAWGSGAAIPPLNFAVPNVDFAEPYAHLPQPQQSVAIIGGHVARTCKISQPSKPMQPKWVKEMQTSLMSFDSFT